MSGDKFGAWHGVLETMAQDREDREFGRTGPGSRWDPGEMPWTIPRRIHPDYRERSKDDPIDWPTVGESGLMGENGSNDE